MKGVVLLEFVNMMDEIIGIEDAQILILKCKLKSEGAYTTSGNFPSSELHALVRQLSQELHFPKALLEEVFGEYLFKKFTVRYQSMFSQANNALDVLEQIDPFIHSEPCERYPEAHTPSFHFREIAPNVFFLTYSSERKLPYLALGLIQATFDYFNEKAQVNIIVNKKSKKETVFEIFKNS